MLDNLVGNDKAHRCCYFRLGDAYADGDAADDDDDDDAADDDGDEAVEDLVAFELAHDEVLAEEDGDADGDDDDGDDGADVADLVALANACGPVPVDEAVADGDGGDDGDDGAGAGGDYRGDDGDDDAYCALPEWRKEAHERQTLFMAALRADKKGALLSSLFSFYVKKDRAVDPPVDRVQRILGSGRAYRDAKLTFAFDATRKLLHRFLRRPG